MESRENPKWVRARYYYFGNLGRGTIAGERINYAACLPIKDRAKSFKTITAL